jgi:hypothetical protein
MPSAQGAALTRVFGNVYLTDLDGACTVSLRPRRAAVLSLLSAGDYPALDSSLAAEPIPAATLRLHIHDTPDACLLATLPKSLPFIFGADGPVVIHCFAGKCENQLYHLSYLLA